MKQSGHPARANASKRTPKRESRPGEPAIGAAGKKLPLKNLPGEASDRCRSAKRHSFEWRFVLQGYAGVIPDPNVATNSSCQPVAFAVVSKLPITRLTRATRFSGRASSPPSRQVSEYSSYLSRLHGAQAHIGRGTPEKSSGWFASIRRSGWRRSTACARGAAREFSRELETAGEEVCAGTPLAGKHCPRMKLATYSGKDAPRSSSISGIHFRAMADEAAERPERGTRRALCTVRENDG
jgi:hypothetical protein